jgi:hypothetical protein
MFLMSWHGPDTAIPKTTLGLYAKVIASKTDHGAALDGIVAAFDWAATGSEAEKQAVTTAA